LFITEKQLGELIGTLEREISSIDKEVHEIERVEPYQRTYIHFAIERKQKLEDLLRYLLSERDKSLRQVRFRNTKKKIEFNLPLCDIEKINEE
jgi:hypothetical protein